MDHRPPTAGDRRIAGCRVGYLFALRLYVAIPAAERDPRPADQLSLVLLAAGAGGGGGGAAWRLRCRPRARAVCAWLRLGPAARSAARAPAFHRQPTWPGRIPHARLAQVACLCGPPRALLLLHAPRR